MIVHNQTVKCLIGQPTYRYLMSDLHLGSPNADHDRITADLAAAQEVGARVLINGDVFDSIGPKDKRYEANCLHPRLRGRKDLEAAVVELAEEILAPYAGSIDVIGIGNHEEAWIKYGYSDPVARLIDRLNQGYNSQIKHGSFWGYVNTTFEVLDRVARHKLLYYHGTGGDSPVTKGTIDFHRVGRNRRYDCLTFGHKHNISIVGEHILDVTPGGRIHERLQLNLQTGSYYRNYSQIEGDPLDYSYAESKAHPPKPLGGLFLVLRPYDLPDGTLQVRQDFSSAVIAPWVA